MVEGGERAKNGRHGLLWIVNAAAMVWSSWDGRPWGDWGWEIMKKRTLWMERSDQKRGVERIEEEKLAFKEKMRILHKVNSEVRKFSHSCDFLRPRPCFWENAHKGNFAQGSHYCAFSHWDFWWGPRGCFLENAHKGNFSQRGRVVWISHQRIG